MKIFLLLLSILLTGCAAPMHMQMYQLQGSARPKDAIPLFDQTEKLEKSDTETTLALCNRLISAHEFVRFEECLNAYTEKADEKFNLALTEAYRANMNFQLGNLPKSRHHSMNSIQLSDFLPLGPYETLARIEAKSGNTEEAYEWMEKLRKLEVKFLFFSLAQDSIGKVKRDAAVRIYLELGEYKLAEQELKKTLPGKSMGEYIFMSTIDFLETDFDKATNMLVDWIAPENTQEWYVGDEINSLYVYGQVALANKNYRDAIQSFRRLLNIPHIEQLRSVYIEGLYHVSRAYQEYGDMEKAERFKQLLEQALNEDAPKIPRPEDRASFREIYSL